MDEPKLGRRARIWMCSFLAVLNGTLIWFLWVFADAAF